VTAWTAPSLGWTRWESEANFGLQLMALTAVKGPPILKRWLFSFLQLLDAFSDTLMMLANVT